MTPFLFRLFFTLAYILILGKRFLIGKGVTHVFFFIVSFTFNVASFLSFDFNAWRTPRSMTEAVKLSEISVLFFSCKSLARGSCLSSYSVVVKLLLTFRFFFSAFLSTSKIGVKTFEVRELEMMVLFPFVIP